ncbi:MAG: TonB-dependent receptor [Pseudomonadota bacterium]
MRNPRTMKSTLAASLALVTGLGAELSLAQVLEEVLVTARKRTENLQDVPIAVSALSAQAIADSGLVRLQDITSLVPNLTYLESNTNKFTNFTLRGISTGGGLGNDPSIGVYIDEVYIARDSGFNGDLLDIERVEVLKGPQGTVFGRNTTVGAINITTRKPGDELEGIVLVDVGNYDYLRYGGLISVPFTDTLAGKLSVVRTERDGYYDNTFGGTVNEVDYTTWRGQLRWTPTDRLEMLFTGNYRKDEADGNNFVTRTVGEPLKKDFEVSIPETGFEDVEDTSYALHVRYDLDSLSFVSITSFQELEESYVNDQDWTPLDDLTTTDTRDMESWSQEFRIESNSSETFTWLAGVYFFHQEFDVFTFPQSGADTIYAFFGLTDLVGSGIPPSETNPAFPDTLDISATSTIETDSAAFFANATWYMNEQWSVNAGIRYSEDKKDLDYEQLADPLAGAAGFFPFTLVDDQDDGEWTPLLSLNWTPTDDILAYVKYSTGYKAGGFNNSVSSSASLVSFDAETLDAYELGFKSTWFQDTLRVNVAIFRMEYNDKQESAFVAGAGFQQSNAGESTSEGFELEVDWVPAENWLIFGAVGYADSVYDEYVLDEFTDYSGNKLTRAPEWTFNAGAQYNWTFGGGLGGIARLEYAYQDEFFTRPNNDPFFAADSQNLVNARLGIRGNDDSWEATLWGRNLTDDDNINSLDGASSFVFPFYHYSLIAPRTYGLELRYNFR